jgi:hypothetical protein
MREVASVRPQVQMSHIYDPTSIKLCEGANTRAAQFQIIQRPHWALVTYSQAALQYICFPQFPGTDGCPCNDVDCETQDKNGSRTHEVQQHLWGGGLLFSVVD